MAKWIAFFSQTGSEIVEVSNRLNRWPDLIITNQRPDSLRTINSELLAKCPDLVVLPNRPTVEDYKNVLGNLSETETIVTLHGWLRVVPEEIVNQCPSMYNGHPGLISKYPELKGKDPQQKAWELGLKESGCVIHKVTAGVDEGPLYRITATSIEGLSLDEIYNRLHDISVRQWVSFLRRHWL